MTTIDWKPDWLRQPTMPVTLVCGPPGGGKTYYVRANAKRGDIMIDLDEIKSTLSGLAGHVISHEPGLLARAVDERNQMLDALADDTKSRHAWVVMGLPKRADRDWWQQKLGAQAVVIETTLEQCARNIFSDRTRDHARAEHIGLARRWWATYD